MRWLILLICLLTAGCLQRGGPPPEISPEMLFHRGSEELAEGKKPEAFATLLLLHPKSTWAERARALNRLAEERKSLEAEVGRYRREGKLKDEELSRLRQDLERLKQLVIEMEMRAK